MSYYMNMHKPRVGRKSGYHAEWDMKPRYRPVYSDESATLNELKEKDLALINLADYINFDDKQRFPYVSTIDAENYPEQNTDYLGATFRLRYMDEEIHEVESAVFKCVRYDAEEPFRAILVNDDKKLMIVTDNQLYVIPDDNELTDDIGRSITNEHVHQIPIQNGEMLGMYVRDGYLGNQKTIGGIVVRADAGGDWPQYVVLEFVSDTEYRLVTFEETKAIAPIYDLYEDNDRSYWPDDWMNLWVDNDAEY